MTYLVQGKNLIVHQRVEKVERMHVSNHGQQLLLFLRYAPPPTLKGATAVSGYLAMSACNRVD